MGIADGHAHATFERHGSSDGSVLGRKRSEIREQTAWYEMALRRPICSSRVQTCACQRARQISGNRSAAIRRCGLRRTVRSAPLCLSFSPDSPRSLPAPALLDTRASGCLRYIDMSRSANPEFDGQTCKHGVDCLALFGFDPICKGSKRRAAQLLLQPPLSRRLPLWTTRPAFCSSLRSGRPP